MVFQRESVHFVQEYVGKPIAQTEVIAKDHKSTMMQLNLDFRDKLHEIVSGRSVPYDFSVHASPVFCPAENVC